MLLIGLHPERAGVAVQKNVFIQGMEEWGYKWVDVTYPEADEEGRREYGFDFTESAFVLRCGRKVSLYFVANCIPFSLIYDNSENINSLSS